MSEPTSSSDGLQGRAPHRRHDALFRTVFSDPEQAQALVRDQLPNEIAGLLAADKLPVVHPGSFIDEDLRESQADLLLEVELVTGGAVFVYVLIEHKSYPDPEVVLQVLGYMVRVWRDYVRKGQDGSNRSGGYDRDRQPGTDLPAWPLSDPAAMGADAARGSVP